MGGRGQRKDKTTQRFMQALLGVTLAANANPPPAVPAEAKLAKDLYSQFINKGKRAKAWKELEALQKSKPSSALCITAAKMHMIAAVEQVCKAEEDAAREELTLQSMHSVLDCACQGALAHASLQCLVLAVFTLHTCRGRGNAEQLAWRRQQAAALEARFGGLAGSAARWAKTKWVDPRVESYEKDRFPFEWEPYSSKNLREWVEAVRDDWNKFMPTIARADQLAAERAAAHAANTSSSDANSSSSSSGAGSAGSKGSLAAPPGVGGPGGERGGAEGHDALGEDLGTPVDVRLAGSFALKHCDKEAIRRHLDALEAKRNPGSTPGALAAPPPPPKPAPTPASTRAGRAATAAAAAAVVQLAAAAGKEERGSGLGGTGLTSGPAPLPPPPAPYSRGGLGADSTSLLPPYQHPPTAVGVGKGRERHRAEQKRQQAQRAQQRATEIQAHLAQQLEPAGDDPEAAQQLLAERCRMHVDEFMAAVRAALAAKEISQAEADLAFANLGRLQGYDGGPPHHVWYGDSHLDMGDRRHEVEGQQDMEDTLTEQLQQDWVIAEEATEWVGSHLDGWRELLARMGLEANTMTDVDRDSMLAQEDPSLGQTLVRVWTEDYPAPPPEGVGAEVDLAADAELEALLPAGARPCSCGRCQREQQQASGASGTSSSSVCGKEAGSEGGVAGVGQEAQPSAPPPRSSQGGAAAAAARRLNGTAEVFTATEQCQAGEFAAVGGAGGSPSRVQLAQQQWREAMHSEEYGSVLQLDVYINEAERSQQYLDSILGRPEGLMQQCRVLAANPEGAPSNEADELVRRAVVGHLMLRLAGAWDDASTSPPQQQQQQQGEEAAGGSESQGMGAAAAAPAAPRAGTSRGSVTQTLHLLRRAMDPSCDLESLIMDCAVDEEAGRCAVAKLGQLREAELAAEAAASKAWAELAAAMQTQEGATMAGGPSSGNGSSSSRGTEPAVAGLMSSMAGRELGAVTASCPGGVAAAEVAAGVDAREDDGAISRPVTFCTPLLTTVLEGAVGATSSSKQPSGSGSSSSGISSSSSSSKCRAGQEGQGAAAAAAMAASASEPPSWEAERARLVRLKGQLARSALLGLGQIWRRRRLTDKMSFQLCQFIADSLATCGELSSREPEREVLRRAAERLLVGPAPAPCVLRLAGWLPLRVLRHLYTFVVLLVGECFASPQDLSEEIEDLVYADASAGALSEDGTTVTVRPAVFAALMPVQPPSAQSPYMEPATVDPLGSRRKGPSSSSGSRGELFALAPAYSLQSVPDLAGPLGLLDPLGAALGAEGASGNWLARVAAYVCTPSDAQQAQQAQQEGGRDEVVGDLHKLWHVEGVLLGLANLCEYWERGLDDSLARMEGLRVTLDQIVAGGKDTPDASADHSKGPFMLEQQLLEARKVLQATEAVELSLRLAVIKMHGVCFEDVLGVLREQPAELDIKDKACTAAAVSKFECMLRDSSAEGEACRARMQELAVAPAPQLEGKEQETVRALGLVLGGNPASQNGQQCTSQQKIRALLAARPERWEASLAAGRDLVLGTLRRLDECTEALATLGEWCYIKQCSLIGQLRSQYCTHSCGDEIVGVLLRVLASQRWEPAILAEQERERSARAQQLERELERERERDAQARAAKKAQRAKQRSQELVIPQQQQQQQQQQPLAEAGEPLGPSANGAAAQGMEGSESDSGDGKSEVESEAAAVVPTEPTTRQDVGAGGGEGDWVADLLARQQARPHAASASAAAPTQSATVAKATKQQGAAERKKQAQQQPREVMRIVSYQGDWLCSCGQVNRLRDPCPSCGQMEPCRDWVRGICDFPQCRFPHPPFDLPATTHLKKSARIANPAPDAPIYGQPLATGAAAAAAAKQPAAAQQKRAAGSGGGGALVPPHHTLAAHISAAAAAAAAAKASTVQEAAGACPSANGAATRSLISARNSSSDSLASAGGGALHAPAELASGPHSNAWGLPPSGAAPPPPTFAAAVASSGPAGSRDPAAAVAAATAAADRSPAWPARSQHLADGSVGGSTGSAATSGRASPAVPPAGSQAAAGAAAAAPMPTGSAAVPRAAGPGPPVKGIAPAVVPLSAFAPALEAGPASHQHANGLPGMPAAHYASAAAAAEAAVRQPPAQPVWGTQALAAQQPLPSQQPLPPAVLQHQQGVNGLDEEAELDEAYFTAFNSQLLQGLGLCEVDDFSSMPSTDLSPHRAPTPPPSLPAGAPGAHNALLSGIVLCLWYCEEFREEVRSWPWTVYTAHPVVKALYALFHALAEVQQPGQVQGKAGAAQQQQSVLGLGPLDHLNAAELEQALPGPLLAAGSAGEVLLAMYERVQEVAAMRALPMLADVVFGIPVGEVVQCRACGRVTQQAAYMQYLLTVQACALREEQQRLAGESASLGRLLRLVADQQKRPCDKAAGGCGALNSVSQVLRREPRVFTLQLAWPEQPQAAQDFSATLDLLQEQVDLADLYSELAPRQFVYRLRCMLCCDRSSGSGASGASGDGHRVLVLAPERGGWLLAEEDAVTCLGPAWADVLVELRALQPLLLFYHRA